MWSVFYVEVQKTTFGIFQIWDKCKTLM
jgi:hypothetical protein